MRTLPGRRAWLAPVTTYAVHTRGHTSAAAGPLLLCYDGSENAAHAIRSAGALFPGKSAAVLTLWQPTAGTGSFAWSAETASTLDFAQLDRAAAANAARIADDGAGIASGAGLRAEPVALEAAAPVWRTIVETAEAREAAAIVMGSRGLTGLRSMLLGSVSGAVVHHADRPVLVVRHPDAGASSDQVPHTSLVAPDGA